MWTRLKRLFRSIFGGIISDAEDPELILNQLMREMQDEVPKMRNNVAQVMAGEKRLAAEVERILGSRRESERAEESRRDTRPPSSRRSSEPPGRTG